MIKKTVNLVNSGYFIFRSQGNGEFSYKFEALVH